MRALCVHRLLLCIRMLSSAPAFPLSGLACFLSGDLASQDMWVRKISRGGLQHPLHQAYSEMLYITVPAFPLVWPCVLPQWRPCVTGHVGSKNIERRFAAPVAHGIFWRHCCELPRRFPCLVLRASSVETLHHRTCGIRKRSRRLQTLSPKVVVDYSS
jgi:hypothetical protein